MAFVEDATVTPKSGSCADRFEFVITATFDTPGPGRQVSLRLPSASQCAFVQSGNPVKRIDKPASGPSVQVTFRVQMRCPEGATTKCVVFARASEPGGDTHEVQRTVTVVC